MKTLRWRKQEQEAYCGVVHGGVDLTYGGEQIGYVRMSAHGWYWVYSHDGHAHNSLWDSTAFPHLDEAKAALKDYARKQLVR